MKYIKSGKYQTDEFMSKIMGAQSCQADRGADFRL